MTSGLATDPQTALQACATALGLALDDHQIDKLVAYLDLLQRWNAVYNLTSVRDPAAMITHHLADCLAVVPPLVRVAGIGNPTLLDVGSGGGLPAVVIAVALPAFAVTSVDTVGKKAAFVRQVAAELRLSNLTVVQARVEQWRGASFDVVGSRAFATLVDFVRLTGSLLKPEGCWMAMKGKVPTDEIAEVAHNAEVFHVEQLRVPQLAAERCLVWMRKHRGLAEAVSL